MSPLFRRQEGTSRPTNHLSLRQRFELTKDAAPGFIRRRLGISKSTKMTTTTPKYITLAKLLEPNKFGLKDDYDVSAEVGVNLIDNASGPGGTLPVYGVDEVFTLKEEDTALRHEVWGVKVSIRQPHSMQDSCLLMVHRSGRGDWLRAGTDDPYMSLPMPSDLDIEETKAIEDFKAEKPGKKEGFK